MRCWPVAILLLLGCAGASEPAPVAVRASVAAEPVEPIDPAPSPPPPRPTPLADQSLWYLSQSEQTPSQLALALEACDQAMEEEGESARTHFACGLAQWRAGDGVGALRRMIRARALEPDRIETLAALGDMLIQTRDYERAVEVLGRAVELRPRDYDLRLGYGVALRGTGQREAAAREYGRAIELDPERADAYFNLAYLRHRCAIFSVEDAMYVVRNYEAFLERAEGVERLAATYEWVSRRCGRRSTRRGRRGSESDGGCEPGLIEQIVSDRWMGRTQLQAMQMAIGGDATCGASTDVERTPIESP
ncbi:MAG: tetratricopeptide repeat protein [Sandaracinaceae bacterium]